MDNADDVNNLRSELENLRKWIIIGPFTKSRKSFERLINWFTAISAGTLLWMAGNFDKFLVKDIIPYKSVILCAGLFIFISVFILIFIRAYLYYVQFGLDNSTELLEFKYDLNHCDIVSELITATGNFFDEARDISKSWSKVDPYMFEGSKIIRLVYACAISYMMGIILIISYVAFFIIAYR